MYLSGDWPPEVFSCRSGPWGINIKTSYPSHPREIDPKQCSWPVARMYIISKTISRSEMSTEIILFFSGLPCKPLVLCPRSPSLMSTQTSCSSLRRIRRWILLNSGSFMTLRIQTPPETGLMVSKSDLYWIGSGFTYKRIFILWCKFPWGFFRFQRGTAPFDPFDPPYWDPPATLGWPCRKSLRPLPIRGTLEPLSTGGLVEHQQPPWWSIYWI